MLILQAFIQSPGETFLNLGFITIRWYGLLISVSVLIGLFVSKKLAKARNIKEKVNLRVQQMNNIKQELNEVNLKQPRARIQER